MLCKQTFLICGEVSKLKNYLPKKIIEYHVDNSQIATSN